MRDIRGKTGEHDVLFSCGNTGKVFSLSARPIAHKDKIPPYLGRWCAHTDEMHVENYCTVVIHTP